MQKVVELCQKNWKIGQELDDYVKSIEKQWLIQLTWTQLWRQEICGFDCNHTTNWRVLKAADKKWCRGILVPHSLTESRKRNRLRFARLHLNRRPRRQFLNNIVTRVEKWVSFANPHRAISACHLIKDQFKRCGQIFTAERDVDQFLKSWRTHSLGFNRAGTYCECRSLL